MVQLLQRWSFLGCVCYWDSTWEVVNVVFGSICWLVVACFNLTLGLIGWAHRYWEVCIIPKVIKICTNEDELILKTTKKKSTYSWRGGRSGRAGSIYTFVEALARSGLIWGGLSHRSKQNPLIKTKLPTLEPENTLGLLPYSWIQVNWLE